MKNTVHTWTYDPHWQENYDIMASLYKYKMGVRDSMLGDLISTCYWILHDKWKFALIFKPLIKNQYQYFIAQIEKINIMHFL